MTVEGAAGFLFVSRTRIDRLIDREVLIEVLPMRPNDKPNIDPTSVHLLRTRQDMLQRVYQDSQTEDTDPLGL
ncbi:hypothetical protein [Paraburkholderia azotifigens]|uniref:Helix-turn-helix domain-containing protein n=1 Tax=Paraburkholderia azotifigens TaxID=2057004 RepID=A0ABU9RGA7_9BURK